MPCLEDSARRFRIPQLYNELPSFLRVVSSWFVLCSMRTEALAIEVGLRPNVEYMSLNLLAYGDRLFHRLVFP